MSSLTRAHEAWPDDLEAASFYGLSILGSVYERDFRTYMRAARVRNHRAGCIACAAHDFAHPQAPK